MPGHARAPDPRPARTRAAILEAIERLGSTGAELTVATVVVEAELSRSSFYSQFGDLGDVAVQLFREIYDEIESLDAELRGKVTGYTATRATTSLLIVELQRRRGLHAAVFGGGAISGETLREIHSIMVRGTLATVRRTAPAGVEPEAAAVYIAAGTLAVLTSWLISPDPVSIPELQAQLFRLLPAWMVSEGPDSAHDSVHDSVQPGGTLGP